MHDFINYKKTLKKFKYILLVVKTVNYYCT